MDMNFRTLAVWNSDVRHVCKYARGIKTSLIDVQSINCCQLAQSGERQRVAAIPGTETAARKCTHNLFRDSPAVCFLHFRFEANGEFGVLVSDIKCIFVIYCQQVTRSLIYFGAVEIRWDSVFCPGGLWRSMGKTSMFLKS